MYQTLPDGRDRAMTQTGLATAWPNLSLVGVTGDFTRCGNTVWRAPREEPGTVSWRWEAAGSVGQRADGCRAEAQSRESPELKEWRLAAKAWRQEKVCQVWGTESLARKKSGLSMRWEGGKTKPEGKQEPDYEGLHFFTKGFEFCLRGQVKPLENYLFVACFSFYSEFLKKYLLVVKTHQRFPFSPSHLPAILAPRGTCRFYILAGFCVYENVCGYLYALSLSTWSCHAK